MRAKKIVNHKVLNIHTLSLKIKWWARVIVFKSVKNTDIDRYDINVFYVLK